MSYVGGVRNSQSETPHPVGSTLLVTCSTPAATAAKVASYSDFDALLDGVEIRIKFIYSNTAANPTLNVNDTGALPIYTDGVNRPGTTAATSWYANSIVSFTYDADSEAWRMSDQYLAGLIDEASARASADSTMNTTLGNCVKYTSQSLSDANKAQARQNIGALSPLLFQNKTVSSWTTVSGTFTYRGTVSCSGVTANDRALVIFNRTNAESGNYSPYAETGADCVYIYSSVNTAVTIPTIIVFRAFDT